MVVVEEPSVFFVVVEPSAFVVEFPVDEAPPAFPPVVEPLAPDPSVAGVVVVVPFV